MTIDVDPVIGSLGPLEFRWYGVIMAVAVAFGLWVMSRELRRRGIASHHVLGIAIFGVPCGIIGARLVHVLDHFGYYLDNPGKIFGVQLVGLAIYGVVGGGLIGVLLYCKWKKLSVLKVIDSTALAFATGQIIGKCANIINGDTWGKPTDSAWSFTYTNPRSFIPDDLLGVATHPTPMYEQLWLVVVVALLIWLTPRLMKVSGLTILAYFWLYSVGRFVISFWRVNDPLLWGLKEAQVIALAVIVLGPILAYWLVRRARRRPPEKPGSQKPGSDKAVSLKLAASKAGVAKPAAKTGKSAKAVPHKAGSPKGKRQTGTSRPAKRRKAKST